MPSLLTRLPPELLETVLLSADDAALLALRARWVSREWRRLVADGSPTLQARLAAQHGAVQSYRYERMRDAARAVAVGSSGDPRFHDVWGTPQWDGAVGGFRFVECAGGRFLVRSRRLHYRWECRRCFRGVGCEAWQWLASTGFFEDELLREVAMDAAASIPDGVACVLQRLDARVAHMEACDECAGRED